MKVIYELCTKEEREEAGRWFCHIFCGKNHHPVSFTDEQINRPKECPECGIPLIYGMDKYQKLAIFKQTGESIG
jgi:transcription initiation factor IIE alpha subunit